MPGATSSFLLIVAMPLVTSSFLVLVVKKGDPKCRTGHGGRLHSHITWGQRIYLVFFGNCMLLYCISGTVCISCSHPFVGQCPLSLGTTTQKFCASSSGAVRCAKRLGAKPPCSPCTFARSQASWRVFSDRVARKTRGFTDRSSEVQKCQWMVQERYPIPGGSSFGSCTSLALRKCPKIGCGPGGVSKLARGFVRSVHVLHHMDTKAGSPIRKQFSQPSTSFIVRTEHEPGKTPLAMGAWSFLPAPGSTNNKGRGSVEPTGR